jgi:hypothetical protein
MVTKRSACEKRGRRGQGSLGSRTLRRSPQVQVQGGEERPEGRGGSKARVAAASLQREGGKPASVYIELVRERGDHTWTWLGQQHRGCPSRHRGSSLRRIDTCYSACA